MSDVIIRVDRLGKKYRIRRQREPRYTALRDVIAEKARRMLRLHRDEEGDPPDIEDFWALQDVTFEVKRGEVVGIIGRNGAGKSTLLKILSRITDPSDGRVELSGRVASLLEVGTGFHPELTGRENIYLNGAILGMSRTEIGRKFDAIAGFAEIEKFLDTPVKHYSSGMYVRLAFAVAAHMEPEILIVDEVLAVGDAQFQKKCIGRMSEVARGGRTVLFVSHNMGAIRKLTQRCLVLEGGRLSLDASVQEGVEAYLKQASAGIADGIFVRPQDPVRDQPFITQRVTTRREAGGEPGNRFDCDHPLFICIEYRATRKVAGLYGYLQLQRADGTVVYEGDSFDARHDPLENLGEGIGMLIITIPPRIFGPGTYQIYLSFASGLDPAGPDVDSPGIVGEFSLDDSSTRRGNQRNGYLSLILDWDHRVARTAPTPGSNHEPAYRQ